MLAPITVTLKSQCISNIFPVSGYVFPLTLCNTSIMHVEVLPYVAST